MCVKYFKFGPIHHLSITIDLHFMESFFDMPLWFTIPFAIFYVAMWVAFFYIITRYHRRRGRQQKTSS